MEEQKKSSKFGLGFVLGAIGGAVAGLFLSPKSGKQMRKEIVSRAKRLRKNIESGRLEEQVRDAFGEVTDEAKKIYETVRAEVVSRLSQVKDEVDITREKYDAMIDEVFEKAKKEFSKDSQKLEKLKTQLLDEWNKIGEME